MFLVSEIVLLREHSHKVGQQQNLGQVVLPVRFIEGALLVVDLTGGLQHHQVELDQFEVVLVHFLELKRDHSLFRDARWPISDFYFFFQECDAVFARLNGIIGVLFGFTEVSLVEVDHSNFEKCFGDTPLDPLVGGEGEVCDGRRRVSQVVGGVETAVLLLLFGNVHVLEGCVEGPHQVVIAQGVALYLVVTYLQVTECPEKEPTLLQSLTNRNLSGALRYLLGNFLCGSIRRVLGSLQLRKIVLMTLLLIQGLFALEQHLDGILELVFLNQAIHLVVAVADILVVQAYIPTWLLLNRRRILRCIWVVEHVMCRSMDVIIGLVDGLEHVCLVRIRHLILLCWIEW